jgi:hypothetical protein
VRGDRGADPGKRSQASDQLGGPAADAAVGEVEDRSPARPRFSFYSDVFGHCNLPRERASFTASSEERGRRSGRIPPGSGLNDLRSRRF